MAEFTLETPRDPDGYLIGVGQTTDPAGDWSPWLASDSRPGTE